MFLPPSPLNDGLSRGGGGGATTHGGPINKSGADRDSKTEFSWPASAVAAASAAGPRMII